MPNNHQIGQIINHKYRLVKLLGQGGMGDVYLGKHLQLKRNVAIKFLHEHAAQQKIVMRFQREAELGAQFKHPNIIEIFDIDKTESGDPYIVMEYLKGETLSSMFKRTGPITLPAAASIMVPVLEALTVIHDAGIIHRDLKPDNIFLEVRKKGPPAVKLIDFGIAQRFHDPSASQMTEKGSPIGTPTYMSPEQVRGDEDISYKTDIFSAGVILYRLLTGKLPFSGDTAQKLLANIMTQPHRPPSKAYPNFPIEAEPLINRLLSKAPNQRPTAQKAIAELKERVAYHPRHKELAEITSSIQRPSVAGVLSELKHPIAPSRRRVKWVALFAAIIATVLAGIIWMTGSTAQIKTVRVHLQGLPTERSIYINEEPFTNGECIHFSNTLSILRISAPGFLDYETEMIPNHDQTIRVKLVPEPSSDDPNCGEIKPDFADANAK